MFGHLLFNSLTWSAFVATFEKFSVVLFCKLSSKVVDSWFFFPLFFCFALIQISPPTVSGRVMRKQSRNEGGCSDSWKSAGFFLTTFLLLKFWQREGVCVVLWQFSPLGCESCIHATVGRSDPPPKRYFWVKKKEWNLRHSGKILDVWGPLGADCDCLAFKISKFTPYLKALGSWYALTNALSCDCRPGSVFCLVFCRVASWDFYPHARTFTFPVAELGPMWRPVEQQPLIKVLDKSHFRRPRRLNPAALCAKDAIYLT